MTNRDIHPLDFTRAAVRRSRRSVSLVAPPPADRETLLPADADAVR